MVRNAFRVGLALLVALALLCGCDLFGRGDGTPAPLTPTPAPTVGAQVPPAGAGAGPTGPTPEAPVETEWTTHAAQALGVTLPHPVGWAVQETGARLTVASSADALAGAELEGPALVVTAVEGATSVQDLLAGVDLQGVVTLRRSEATVGGEAGQAIDLETVSPLSGRGYVLRVAAAIHGGKGYVVAASAPVEQWAQYGPDLEAMVEGLAFR